MKRIASTISIFLCVSLFSSVIEENKNKSGIELFFLNYDWDNMWSEIVYKPNLRTCKVESLKDGLFSPFDATIIEPLYLAGASIDKGKIKAFNVNISSGLDSSIGTAREDGGIYLSVVKTPFMDLLLGNSTRGALVFEKGSITPVYIGMFDPKKWDNILASDMAPELRLFSDMRAQLAGIVPCLANSTYDKLSGSTKRDSGVASSITKYMDMFFFSNGCAGPMPTGSSTTHHDPITNGIAAINTLFYDMFNRKGYFADYMIKHTTMNYLNGYTENALCHPIINPAYPHSMFSAQLLYPTISTTHELGVEPANYEFHASTEADLDVLFVINKRRDYAAFAYKE